MALQSFLDDDVALFQELKDAKVVDMNCLAYISHRNREGKHVSTWLPPFRAVNVY